MQFYLIVSVSDTDLESGYVNKQIVYYFYHRSSLSVGRFIYVNSYKYEQHLFKENERSQNNIFIYKLGVPCNVFSFDYVTVHFAMLAESSSLNCKIRNLLFHINVSL